MSTWVNGTPDGELSAEDRALSYGDGLFETMRLEAHGVRHLERHLARLAHGCARLGFDRVSIPLVRDEIDRVAQALDDGVLKLIITRGPGPRGYRPTGNELPTRVLSWSAVSAADPKTSEEGVSVRFCTTPATQNTALAGLKHLNRLDSVLARREWSDPTIAEGLLSDSQGSVVGGTMSNLFVVHGETIVTPKIERAGVAGIMRGVVMEVARRAGLPVVEQDMHRTDVVSADELFLTNSIIGIWPVRKLETQDFPSGAVTRLLKELSQP